MPPPPPVTPDQLATAQRHAASLRRRRAYLTERLASGTAPRFAFDEAAALDYVIELLDLVVATATAAERAR